MYVIYNWKNVNVYLKWGRNKSHFDINLVVFHFDDFNYGRRTATIYFEWLQFELICWRSKRYTWPMRGGGFSWYIGTGPGEPRKGTWISEGPHWHFIFIFSLFFFVFSTQIHNFERSFNLSSDPKAVLFHLAKFLLEALVQSVVDKSLRFVMAQLVRHLATSLLKSSNDKSKSAWYASYIEAT